MQGCALFNSGTTHLKYTASDTKFGEVHYENKEKIGDISFSIRNIEHPERYGRWNSTLRLRPSIHLDKENYRPKKNQRDKIENFDELPDIRIRRFLAFGDLRGSLHTPAGAFVLSLGVGGVLSERRDNGDLNYLKTQKATKIDLAWIAFITRRLFFMTGPRYYNEEYEQFIWSVRLGLFWGVPGNS